VPAFVQNGKRLLEASQKMEIVLLARLRYLSELTETVRRYNRKEEEQSEITNESYTLDKSVKVIKE
jgi:methylmalonyl-CoA mutase